MRQPFVIGKRMSIRGGSPMRKPNLPMQKILIPTPVKNCKAPMSPPYTPTVSLGGVTRLVSGAPEKKAVRLETVVSAMLDNASSVRKA